MRIWTLAISCIWAAACSPQDALTDSPGNSSTDAPVFFEGARLIVGDGSDPIESSAFVVEGGRFAQVGRQGEVHPPQGAIRVDLTGRTVMPAIIDVHSHIGYMKDLTSGPENYTPDHILDHMYRFAYYGVAASQSMGSDFGDMPFVLRDEIQSGKYPDAARFLSAGRGLAPLNEISPDNMRHAAYVVTTEEGARADVRELVNRGVTIVKTWVDSRGGSIEPLAPNLYQAIIDEAHQNGIRVAVHATGLEDAKNLLRADIDVFAHMITDLDEELVELFRRHPETSVLTAQVGRRTIYAPYLNPPSGVLLDTVTLEQINRLRAGIEQVSPERLERARASWEQTAADIMTLHRAGVRFGIGSDGGGQGGDRFIGFTAHTELENLVHAGMTPMEAIVVGTHNGAEILGLDAELGSVSVGKSADFIVLTANPLDDITNTRAIQEVYLRGHRVDRERLRAGWSGR